MDFYTPFGGPYTNEPAPWHLGGHFVCSFNDDRGYASSDPDSPPYPSFDPDNDIDGDADPFDHVSPRPRYQQATVLVNAQYSHTAAAFAAFRPHHRYRGSSNKGYDLPQPLPFEQQGRNYEYTSQRNPTPSYHRGNRDREPNLTTSLQDFRANTASSLNFNEHGARLPDTLSPLSDRVVEIETEEESSLPRSPTPVRRKASSFPDDNNPELLKTKLHPQSRSKSPTISFCFPPRNLRRTGENWPPSSSSSSAARRDASRRHHCCSPPPSPSSFLSDSDGRRRILADAWRQLYHERKQFEAEKRAFDRTRTEKRLSRHVCDR